MFERNLAYSLRQVRNENKQFALVVGMVVVAGAVVAAGTSGPVAAVSVILGGCVLSVALLVVVLRLARAGTRKLSWDPDAPDTTTILDALSPGDVVDVYRQVERAVELAAETLHVPRRSVRAVPHARAFDRGRDVARTSMVVPLRFGEFSAAEMDLHLDMGEPGAGVVLQSGVTTHSFLAQQPPAEVRKCDADLAWVVAVPILVPVTSERFTGEVLAWSLNVDGLKDGVAASRVDDAALARLEHRLSRTVAVDMGETLARAFADR